MNNQALKEELVDLQTKLAEAENQVRKIGEQLPLKAYRWTLIYDAHESIRKANDKLYELAKLLGLIGT